MISPHTPSGTKVEVVGDPAQVVEYPYFYFWTRKRTISRRDLLGKRLTVALITICDAGDRSPSGFWVHVEESTERFCLYALRCLALPKSLTSLLHTQPSDLEVVD